MDGYNNQCNGKIKQTRAFYCGTLQETLDYLSPNQQDNLASSPHILPQKTMCASPPKLPSVSLTVVLLPSAFSLTAETSAWWNLVFGLSQQKLLDCPSSLQWFVLVLYQYLPARLARVRVLLPPVLASAVTSACAPLQGKQQVFPPDHCPPTLPPPKKPNTSSVPSHFI